MFYPEIMLRGLPRVLTATGSLTHWKTLDNACKTHEEAEQRLKKFFPDQPIRIIESDFL